jgi:hypothetical protein
VLGNFLRLYHDPGEAGVAERVAVEQVPDTARFARAGAAEVHARQPGRVTRADVKAAFFGNLTPASVCWPPLTVTTTAPFTVTT